MKSLLAIIISPFTTIWHGYVLRVIWGWFLVPYFGIKPLNIPEAIGITILASYLTHQMYTGPDESEDKNYKFLRSILLATLLPAIMLLNAYVVHLFL